MFSWFLIMMTPDECTFLLDGKGNKVIMSEFFLRNTFNHKSKRLRFGSPCIVGATLSYVCTSPYPWGKEWDDQNRNMHYTFWRLPQWHIMTPWKSWTFLLGCNIIPNSLFITGTETEIDNVIIVKGMKYRERKNNAKLTFCTCTILSNVYEHLTSVQSMLRPNHIKKINIGF